MAFIKSKATNFILKKRIDIGLEMGEEKPEDVYIIFREPSEQQKVELNEAYSKSGSSAKDQLQALYKFLVELIYDHNFYETEELKMKPEGVLDVLKEKSFALERVIVEFVGWIKDPFPKMSVEK